MIRIVLFINKADHNLTRCFIPESKLSFSYDKKKYVRQNVLY